MEKERAIRILSRHVNSISHLRLVDVTSASFQQWHQEVCLDLKQLFPRKNYSEEFENIAFWTSPRSSYSKKLEIYESGLDDAKVLLNVRIKEIENHWTDRQDNEPSKRIKKGSGRNDPARQAAFIVHGHDETAKEMVTIFLEALDVEPIILHKQANQGRTVIEKFEENSGVPYAIVLLTPDDVGRSMQEQSARHRARQNVVFEMGFFMGKLGRQRVACLRKADVEIPTDISGVVYIDFDSNNEWQRQLRKELKGAGLIN